MTTPNAQLKIWWDIQHPADPDAIIADGYRRLPAQLAQLHATVTGPTTWQITGGQLLAQTPAYVTHPGTANAVTWHRTTNTPPCRACLAHTALAAL